MLAERADLSSQDLQHIFTSAENMQSELDRDSPLACLTHLDADLIPQQATRKYFSVAILAHISVMGLCSLPVHGAGDGPCGTMLKAWPVIFKWVEFLQQHFFVDQQSPLYLGVDIGNEFCCSNFLLLAQLQEMGPPNAHLAHTPGVTSMIIKIWVLTLEKGAPQDLHAQAGTLLRLTLPEQHPRHVVQETEGVLCGQANEVAATALERLRSYLVGYKPKYDLFAVDLGVVITIHIILGHAADWWNNALLSHHCINVISKSLFDLTSKPFSPSTAADVGICINFCYSYLAVGLNFTDGVTWVTQALDMHLLPSMLKSGRWIPDDPECNRLAILTNVLPGYLIYHSVLRSIQRSMEKITSQNLTCLSSDILFRESWSRFVAMVQERLDVKLEVDQGEIRTKTCNNTDVRLFFLLFVHTPLLFPFQCGKVGHEMEFKLCAGCKHFRSILSASDELTQSCVGLTARYCSKACQQHDWTKPGNHRVTCKHIQARRRGNLFQWHT